MTKQNQSFGIDHSGGTFHFNQKDGTGIQGYLSDMRKAMAVTVAIARNDLRQSLTIGD